MTLMFPGTYGSKILQHQLLNSKTSVNLRKEPGTGNIDCFDLLQISYAPKHIFISQMHPSKGESQSQWSALPCSTHTHSSALAPPPVLQGIDTSCRFPPGPLISWSKFFPFSQPLHYFFFHLSAFLSYSDVKSSRFYSLGE